MRDYDVTLASCIVNIVVKTIVTAVRNFGSEIRLAFLVITSLNLGPKHKSP